MGCEVPNSMNRVEDPQPYDERGLYWQCKYCGENETPKCYKCVREDGKPVSDELEK